ASRPARATSSRRRRTSCTAPRRACSPSRATPTRSQRGRTTRTRSPAPTATADDWRSRTPRGTAARRSSSSWTSTGPAGSAPATGCSGSGATSPSAAGTPCSTRTSPRSAWARRSCRRPPPDRARGGGRTGHGRARPGRPAEVSLGPVELIRKGKVREVYADGYDVILVASDSVSVYDVVLPTPVPDKGAILTQLSLWWFRQFADLVPNHVISEDVPAEWAGRAIRCKRLDIVPVECIARGYLTGGGLESYRATGTVSGVAFPPGLVEASRLPEPVFTPSTKAEEGHDEYISVEEIARDLGEETTTRLKDLTL